LEPQVIQRLKSSPSLCAILLIACFYLFQLYQLSPWKSRFLTQDVKGHYSYLPAVLVYGDLSFKYEDDLNKQCPDLGLDTKPNEDGLRIAKPTMGVALLQAPFYMFGRALALISGYPDHGYSKLEYNFVCLGTWFYAFLALWYLRKLWLLFFAEWVSTIGLVIIALATNVYFYTIVEGGMYHIPALACLSVFLFFGVSWLRNGGKKLAIIAGLSFGLFVLIRPTNIYFGMVLCLFEVTSWLSLKNRIKWLLTHNVHLKWFVLTACLTAIPQLMYWHWFTGSWFYSSSDEVGYYFKSPHILDGLLSYRKGLLVYTPIFWLTVFGWLLVAFNRLKSEAWRWLVLILIPVSVYIISSWWCWWYGSSFGNQGFIELFPILVFPILLLIQEVLSYRNWLLWPVVFVLSSCIILNIHQTNLYIKGHIHDDAMTKNAFWLSLTQKKLSREYYNSLREPDYMAAMLGENEYNSWQVLNENNRFSDQLEILEDELKDHRTLIIEGDILSQIQRNTNQVKLVISLLSLDGKEVVHSYMLPDYVVRGTSFNFPYTIPSMIEGSSIKAYLYYIGSSSLVRYKNLRYRLAHKK